MKMVEVDNLTKSYGKNLVLNNINLRLNSNRIVAYLGPNGSGKTTTIKALTKLIKPDSGKITILGKDTEKAFFSLCGKLGVILDSSTLYNYLTGKENIELFARLMGMQKNKTNHKINTLLEQLNSISYSNKLVKTYSKGMKRRIELARTLIYDPQVLLIDEPFDGIDVDSKYFIIHLLKEWVKKEERCIFMTSHNINDVEAFCDDIYIIKSGKILLSDSVLNLKSSSLNKRLFIKTSSNYSCEAIKDIFKFMKNISYSVNKDEIIIYLDKTIDINNIVFAFSKNGINISEINYLTDSLEEIYLKQIRK